MCGCTNHGPGYVDLGQLITRLTQLEASVATEAEQISALQGQFSEFVEDVNAKIAALEAAQGNFSAEGQAAFDTLKASVGAAAAAVGDADGDGSPAPSTPEEPNPEAPIL